MNKLPMTAAVILIASAACDRQPTKTAREGTGTETRSVTVNLPPGSVEAGRQAFIDLQCATCHAVPSDPEFPAPVSVNPGPPIDARLASRDVSYLLTAIVSPSHVISPDTSSDVRARLEDALSPMGDYSQAMTVRQLIDLHSYLRSVK